MNAETMPGVGPVDEQVRPLVARLSVLQVLLAERHPDHHATVHEALLLLDRWEGYRAELADMEQRLGKLARNFLDCGSWEDAAKCALKAEGMRWVRGRMPPAA
jgi:hypothetical protein